MRALGFLFKLKLKKISWKLGVQNKEFFQQMFANAIININVAHVK